METTAGNKLISIFMGGKKFDGTVWYYVGPDGFQHESGEYLKYHTSWDWLMPVVELIETANFCSYQVFLGSNVCYITDKSRHGTPVVVRAANNDRLINTYNLIIEFIKWYNAKPTKP